MKQAGAWALGALLAAAIALPADARGQGPFLPYQGPDTWRSPGGIAVSPDGRNVYVSGRQGLLTLERNAVDGSLKLGTWRVDPYGGTGGGVLMAPDGSSVYVVRQDESDAKPPVKAFRRAPDGGLTAIDVDDSRQRNIEPTGAGISPLGDRVFAPNSYRGIGLYLRAPTGELRLTGEVPIPSPQGPSVHEPMVMDSAGRLYVGLGFETSEIGVFEPVGDSIELVQRVPCFCGSRGMTITTSGRRLVVGAAWRALAFERDPVTGRLGPMVDGYGSGGGLGWQARPLATHGQSMYMLDEDSVHETRFTDTRWQVLRTWRNGVGGANGLDDPRALAVSPDGRNVYVASGSRYGDDGPPGTVAVFARDPATGALSFTSLFTGPHPEPGANLRINGGARYTNSRDVRVTARSVDKAGVVLSNDPGFLGSKYFFWRVEAYPWTLSAGRDGAQKTVYARVDGTVARASIVLDTRVPVITATRRSAGRRGRDRLRIRAKDAVSGPALIQVSARRKRPGKWRRYSSRKRHVVAARRKTYVRLRDRAGNTSRWKTVPTRRHKRARK